MRVSRVGDCGALSGCVWGGRWATARPPQVAAGGRGGRTGTEREGAEPAGRGAALGRGVALLSGGGRSCAALGCSGGGGREEVTPRSGAPRPPVTFSLCGVGGAGQGEGGRGGEEEHGGNNKAENPAPPRPLHVPAAAPRGGGQEGP